MRYAAIALLIAAIAPSAVRAQAPQREGRPLSAQPKVEGPELVVKPQPDSPLRLSVTITGVVDPRAYWVNSSVENLSERDVSAYTIRRTPGNNILGLCDGHMGLLPHDKVLRPGKRAGHSTIPGFSPPSPVYTFEVDFVEFTDGSTWGADACRTSEYLAGERAGGGAAVGRLLELLAGGGPDAVMQAVEEELAGFGSDAVKNEAIRLGLAKRGPGGVLWAVKGEAVRRHSPDEHTPVWELGFFIGTKKIAERVRQAVKKSGPGEIEPTLRLPYDAAGAR